MAVIPTEEGDEILNEMLSYAEQKGVPSDLVMSKIRIKDLSHIRKVISSALRPYENLEQIASRFDIHHTSVMHAIETGKHLGINNQLAEVAQEMYNEYIQKTKNLLSKN